MTKSEIIVVSVTLWEECNRYDGDHTATMLRTFGASFIE